MLLRHSRCLTDFSCCLAFRFSKEEKCSGLVGLLWESLKSSVPPSIVKCVTRDCGANHGFFASNSLMLQALWKDLL